MATEGHHDSPTPKRLQQRLRKKPNADVPLEQKARSDGAGTGLPWRGASGEPMGFGWCQVTAQHHGVAVTQPRPQPRGSADAMAQGDEDGDEDLLDHPELCW